MEPKKPYVKPEIRFFPAGSPQFSALMAVINPQPQDHQKQEEKNV